MLDKLLLKNAYNARYFLGGMFGIAMIMRRAIHSSILSDEVFGFDGNGGAILKIITDLTDEEMARLKYVRRTCWHWSGSRRADQGNVNTIQDQELSDRGIEWPQEPYIEYIKRPPHDKYL